MIVKTQNTYKLLSASCNDSQRSLSSAEMPVQSNEKVSRKLSRKSPGKTKKSVSFHEKVRCTATLHVNDYTDEEYVNSWYQKHEFREIRREIANTIQLYEAGAIQGDSTKFCLQGVENKMAMQAQRKRDSKMMAWSAVLDAQTSFFGDADMIASAYSEAVQLSAADARARNKGIKDEANAQHTSRRHQSRKRKGDLFGRSR